MLLAIACAGAAYGGWVAGPIAATALADHERGSAGPWRVRGRLATDPQPLGGAWQLDLAVETILVDGRWRAWPLRVRTTVYDAGGARAWRAGQGFETFLALRAPRPARNPLVPERAALTAAGADVRASLKSFRQLRRREPVVAPPPGRLLSAARAALRAAIERRFGDRTALVDALLLGERGRVPQTLTDALARTGLIHLLAVSGLHVGIMVTALFALLRGAGLARPHAAVALIAALPLIHGLVVPRPPVARACLMAATLLLGVAAGRRPAALNGLALATLVLTAADPRVTHNFGFQLSTAATAGILLLGHSPRAMGRSHPSGSSRWRGAAALRWLGAAAAVSAVAQLAVAPLLAATSFRLPTVSIALNVAAVPLLAATLISAWLAVGAGALGLDAIAAALAMGTAAALDGLQSLAHAADERSAALTVPASVTVSVTVAAICGMVLLATRRTGAGSRSPTGLRVLRAALLVVAAGCAAMVVHAAQRPPALPADTAFRLVAFDVGQGDALLLESASAALMIDTGGSPVSDFDPGTALLAPALRARGIDRLDGVIITHLHADHAGGLAGLLREIDAGAVWTPAFDAGGTPGQRLRHAARDVPVVILARGDELPVGDCLGRVLHPPAPRAGDSAEVSNDRSLVLALRCAGRELLVTGDAEAPAEALYGPLLPDSGGAVLKSPHHGSRTSSGTALLDRLGARHVVIAAGWRNRFGLPNGEVLERYRSRRMAVYRTDRDGAVTVTAGRRIRVTAERWTAGRGRRVVGGWLH